MEANNGLITHLSDLTPDPNNARRHSPRNVGMLVDSLHAVGAARSIVIDEHGLVLAGNATIDAAAQAGIERVRVVEADGNEIIAVRRCGLTNEQKTKLALYDNRTADLAGWDADVLCGIVEQDATALDGLFRQDELAALLASMQNPLPAPGDAQVSQVPEIWSVIVECGTEARQLDLLERLGAEGYNCKALIS